MVATVFPGLPPGTDFYEPVSERLFKYLRNGSNSPNMAVDGSSTPVEFSYQPPTDQTTRIFRMLFYIRDNSAAGPDEFGAISGGLSNGIKLEVLDSGDNVIFDFLDGTTIQNNGELGLLAYDVQNIGAGIGGDDIYLCRLSFDKSGHPLDFPSGHDYRIAATVQDNLSTLVEMRISVQGHTHGQ